MACVVVIKYKTSDTRLCLTLDSHNTPEISHCSVSDAWSQSWIMGATVTGTIHVKRALHSADTRKIACEQDDL